jgi:hypothetical protein
VITVAAPGRRFICFAPAQILILDWFAIRRRNAKIEPQKKDKQPNAKIDTTKHSEKTTII